MTPTVGASRVPCCWDCHRKFDPDEQRFVVRVNLISLSMTSVCAACADKRRANQGGPR